MEEIWRPVVGYETCYEVSNHGQIRRIIPSQNIKLAANDIEVIRQAWLSGEGYASLARRYGVAPPTIKSALHYPAHFSYRTTHRVLKPWTHKQGYLHVELHKEGKGKTFRVHILIATSFIGPIPPKGEVNHLNGNKSDNRLENLEITDHRGNQIHAYYVLNRRNLPRGSKHSKAKLHETDIPVIRQLFAQGASYKTIENLFHVTSKTLANIKFFRTWYDFP